MKQLLADYIFSDALRYENHRLINGADTDTPIEIGGFLGAAILGALLYGTEEGRERGINLKTREGRKEFFERYEDEMLHENGGFFITEVQTLSEAYMEIDGDIHVLLAICGNERLCDLAFGLMIDYMETLVEEQVCEHIYDLCPWSQPFARWLYNAGFIETRRLQLLAIDWADPAIVYALSEFLRKPTEETRPTFAFNDTTAEQVIKGYWEWLWNAIQQEASLYPDTKERLARYKQGLLETETNYDFLKPEIGKLQPTEINIFRKWMNQWIDFVKQQIEPPITPAKKDLRQELFLDNVMTVPPEHNYVEVKKYILERCRYDEEFKKYFKAHKMTDFCRQLTLLFGWYVDPNALGKRMKSKAKK